MKQVKALVLGYGRSGKAAEALLKARGCEVVVLDGEDEFPQGASFAFAVVSPGVALTHPWIAACRERAIPFKSELQLGCEELRRRGWRLLGVTGSKGKSSVVKLVADAIMLSGAHAVACGNYGVPVCEVALADANAVSAAGRWAVVEVSSFMMETTKLPRGTFEAAAVLNLQEDHLDRHGSVEVYHALKRKLLTMAKDDENARDWSVRDAHRLAESVCPDGSDAIVEGSYFDNPILRRNALAAIGLLSPLKLSAKVLRRAFTEFKALPHRMNTVAELDGVRYIDDSKATSLAALEAGVKMVACGVADRRNVRLVAGGLPKGDDPKNVLSVLTERVKKVYLIGQSAEMFRSVWETTVDCEVCGTMERAVRSVMREAVKGETVLLSPGTASFDQFQSFGERGDVFADLVKSKGQRKK